MSKIALDDPIWTRLYGPYGVRDVPSLLESLASKWDEGRASQLFWEELHHQNDLYPVTFAALPWLWDIVQKLPSQPKSSLDFFSHVLRCAVAPCGTGRYGAGPRGKYRGLSVNEKHHAHSFIPSNQRLEKEDMSTLDVLERWFEQNASIIADTCLEAIETKEKWEVAILIEGPIALHGAEEVAQAVTMWADEVPMEEIISETSPSLDELKIAMDFSNQLKAQNLQLSDFLRSYAESVK